MKINLSFLPAALPNRDSPFRRLVGALGVGAVNVENAPVMLNALFTESLYLTRRDLMDRVSHHYMQQGLRQVDFFIFLIYLPFNLLTYIFFIFFIFFYF